MLNGFADFILITMRANSQPHFYEFYRPPLMRRELGLLKSLTRSEMETFSEEGMLYPKRIISETDAEKYLAELEDYENETGAVVNGKFRYKCHLLFPWINELMRNKSILDIVEDILGPNLMVWTTHLYPKEPNDGRFISWHQDSAHWGLDSDKILTVWLALTPSTRSNGCMRMLPGSQKTRFVKHHDTWDDNNILTRGQTISSEVDENEAHYVELQPGEVSLHHLFMWHASYANKTKSRRVGVAFRYITPDARQTRVDTDFATLVRGVDAHQNFVAEPTPIKQMDPKFIKLHEEIAEIQGRIYMSGTEKAGLKGLADP